MFGKEIGIDLGTANTVVYLKGKGIIIREPSVVAVDTRTDTVKCIGNEAKDVIGRTPGTITTVRPLKDGVIADFDVTCSMLQELMHRAANHSAFSKPRVVICIPSGVTPVEKRAVREATEKAGARQVLIVEEPMAAAIGAGLPVSEPTGSMVVDIGGGTTEVAVLSLGGLVSSQSIKIGGDKLDASIIEYIKNKYNILIGDRTAELIKIEIGNVCPTENTPKDFTVTGRNLVSGLPESLTIRSEEVREALIEPAKEIIEAIRTTMEQTPPELAADIIDQGIMLTGGGALLRGMDILIAAATGIHVAIAEDPLDCVAKGTGMILENITQFSAIASGQNMQY